MASFSEPEASIGTHVKQFRGMTLAQIVISVPGAAMKLRTYGIDFYRDFNIALERAATIGGVQVESIEAELAARSPVSEEADPDECNRLIEHILRRYHDTHRQDLPVLVDMARKVESVHQAHPAVPNGLSSILQEFAAELESHMAKEEEVLFPMMLSGGHPMIVYPIERMMLEHNEHAERIDSISRVTNNFRPPSDACATWQALYGGLQVLISDLTHHIQLENNLLFPQFIRRACAMVDDKPS